MYDAMFINVSNPAHPHNLFNCISCILDMEYLVSPAILVKGRDDMLSKISSVKGAAKTIHIDIMDGRFVPNTTIRPIDLMPLPIGPKYYFHWMVEDGWEQSLKYRQPDIFHILHVETLKHAVPLAPDRYGISLNPETPLQQIIPYLSKVRYVLVMSVHPGFSGQKYIPDVEDKIRKLRRLDPTIDIAVDDGMNEETAVRAIKAGANIICAASAIFGKENPKTAFLSLNKRIHEVVKHGF